MLLDKELWNIKQKPLATFYEQFKKAIADDNEEDIIRMFAVEGLINKRLEEGRHSPLEHAATFGSAKMVQLLVDLGADPDKGYNVPLLAAINADKHENMLVLLIAGARSRYSDSSSFLHTCKSIQSFRVLIDYIYQHDQQAEHNMKEVALMRCRNNSSAYIEMVVDKTDDDEVLNAVFTEMAGFSHPEACKKAVDKIKVFSISNEDLLFKAIDYGATDVLQILCESGRFAVNRCKACKVKVQTHGAYFTDFTRSMTPLAYAVYCKKLSEVQYLITCPGIDPNSRIADTGMTALIAAVKEMSHYENDNHEMVVALLSNKLTNVDICDGEQRAALFYAIGKSRSMRNFEAILARCQGEVSFNPDLMEVAVNPKNNLDYAMLMKLLSHPKMNAGLLHNERSMLHYAVLAGNPELVLQLLARADIDVNVDMVYTIVELAKNQSPFLMPFILHGDIYIDLFKSYQQVLSREKNEKYDRAFEAQSLYLNAWRNFEEDPREFYNEILKSYEACPLVLYNRVMYMITRFQAQNVSEDQFPRYLALINALLNFQIIDDHFKLLAHKLGEFIYGHDWDIENRNELVYLFLQYTSEQDAKMFTCNLFKLAGLTDNPTEIRSISELLADPTIRTALLTGMGKANHFRLLTLDLKPSMKQRFVELYYKDDPCPLKLMWNIARLHASTHAISSETAEQNIEQIVALYEDFLASQSKPVTSPLLAQSLSAAIKADSAVAEQPKDIEVMQNIL